MEKERFGVVCLQLKAVTFTLLKVGRQGVSREVHCEARTTHSVFLCPKTHASLFPLLCFNQLTTPSPPWTNNINVYYYIFFQTTQSLSFGRIYLSLDLSLIFIFPCEAVLAVCFWQHFHGLMSKLHLRYFSLTEKTRLFESVSLLLACLPLRVGSHLIAPSSADQKQWKRRNFTRFYDILKRFSFL